MKFNKIPEHVLNYKIAECHDTIAHSIRDDLKKHNEDIIYAEFEYFLDDPEQYLLYFTAWSANYIFMLLDDPFGGRYIKVVDRDPPHER